MDKSLKEQKIFDHIYSGLPFLDLKKSESPDFLVRFSEQLILGVEITELHASKKHTRLKNQQGYYDGLLDGSKNVHNDDKSIAEVLTADVTLPNGKTQQNSRVLVVKGLSFIQAIAKLEKSIRRKIAKTDAYKKQCQLVDLIVYDEHSLFKLNTLEDMQHYLYEYIDNNMLHQLVLREVYFITDLLSIGKIALPLRLNHFLGDALSLLYLVQNELTTDDKLSVWKVVLAALHVVGHRNIFFGYRSDFMTIQFGAWEIHLTHSSAKVTELTYQPNRFKLGKEAQHVYASLDESLLKVVREVVEKRPQIIRYLPTYKTLTI